METVSTMALPHRDDKRQLCAYFGNSFRGSLQVTQTCLRVKQHFATRESSKDSDPGPATQSPVCRPAARALQTSSPGFAWEMQVPRPAVDLPRGAPCCNRSCVGATTSEKLRPSENSLHLRTVHGPHLCATRGSAIQGAISCALF